MVKPFGTKIVKIDNTLWHFAKEEEDEVANAMKACNQEYTELFHLQQLIYEIESLILNMKRSETIDEYKEYDEQLTPRLKLFEELVAELVENSDCSTRFADELRKHAHKSAREAKAIEAKLKRKAKK